MRMRGILALAVLQCLIIWNAANAAQIKRTPGVLTVQAVPNENRAIASYIVFLNRRFGTDELDTFSHHVRRAAPKSELIVISFFLRGMNPQLPPWATSYFTAKLDGFVVRIDEASTTTNVPEADLQQAVR